MKYIDGNPGEEKVRKKDEEMVNKLIITGNKIIRGYAPVNYYNNMLVTLLYIAVLYLTVLYFLFTLH